MSARIDVEHVTKHFGGLTAVDDCTLSVEAGSITGLIGPNGAGKTTLFNMVAGTLRPDGGTIRMEGQDITGLRSNVLCAKGLMRTFQIAHEFSHMTVLENLMMVPGDQAGEHLFSAWFRPSFVRRQEDDVRTRALEVVDFLSLNPVRNELAGNLSGGQKKLLELGRTMMMDARVVLLDEIAAGVNRTLLRELVANIERLNREMHYTFFVIEHDMDLIAQLCDPVIVMAEGRVMMEGTIAEVQANPAVIEAYFGTDEAREEPA